MGELRISGEAESIRKSMGSDWPGDMRTSGEAESISQSMTTKSMRKSNRSQSTQS